MGHQEEEHAATPVGKSLIEHEVTVPIPEDYLANKLKINVPPCRALFGGLALQQVLPAEASEIKARQHHDRIIGIVLDLKQELGGHVEGHFAIIVGAPHAVKKAMGDAKERNVLNIGVENAYNPPK